MMPSMKTAPLRYMASVSLLRFAIDFAITPRRAIAATFRY